MKRDRGFALVIVLWALGLLALLGTAVTATGRQQTRLATAVREAADAHAVAEAALHETVFDLLAGRVTANGAVRVLPVGTARATSVARTEDGKLNPNTAPPELMAALLQVCGAAGPQAAQVAAAIVAWRGGAAVGGVAANGPDPALLAAYRAAGSRWGPTGQPFRDVGDLRLVLGMTPALFAALVPHVSVYPEGVLDAAAADPLVRTALRQVGVTQPGGGGTLRGGPSVVLVEVEARTAAGAVARIRTVVRIDPANPARAFAFLTWEEP